jgi:hypothetical protein
MRLIFALLGVAVLCAPAARAAVTKDQFPPKTTADLIALCSASSDDPLMTAAVNFCQGFAEGVVEVALGYEAVTRKDREPFCLPHPAPTQTEALAQFTAWANAAPARLQSPPSVGILQFLTEQYPCPRPAPARARKK